MFCRPRVAARGAPAGARTLRAPRLRRATKSATRRTAGDTAEADGTAEAGKHVSGTAEADGHVGDTVAAERTGAAHFSLAEVLLLVPEWGMHKLMMAAAALVVVQAPATAARQRKAAAALRPAPACRAPTLRRLRLRQFRPRQAMQDGQCKVSNARRHATCGTQRRSSDRRCVPVLVDAASASCPDSAPLFASAEAGICIFCLQCGATVSE